MPDITITVANETRTRTLTGPQAQRVLELFLLAQPNTERDRENPTPEEPQGPLIYTNAEWVVETMFRNLKNIIRRGKKIELTIDDNEAGELIDE